MSTENVTAKWFASLSKRDLENGAVMDEIYQALKQRDDARAIFREGATSKIMTMQSWRDVAVRMYEALS